MRIRALQSALCLGVLLLTLAAPGSAQLGTFVQGSIDVQIQDTAECRTRNLYDVPVGKRLRIDWISIEAAEFGGDDFDPVDVTINTRLGGVLLSHPLVRIDNALVVGTSFFKTQIWSSQVTLYAQGGKKVTARACRNNSTDGTSVIVSFHGQLFDEP